MPGRLAANSGAALRGPRPLGFSAAWLFRRQETPLTLLREPGGSPGARVRAHTCLPAFACICASVPTCVGATSGKVCRPGVWGGPCRPARSSIRSVTTGATGRRVGPRCRTCGWGGGSSRTCPAEPLEVSCPCLDPQESHLQCRLVQEDSDPPAGVPWKGSPFKKREPEASAARAMGSRSGVKGQKYGNSVPPLTLRGLGPALWRPLGLSLSPDPRGFLAEPPAPGLSLGWGRRAEEGGAAIPQGAPSLSFQSEGGNSPLLSVTLLAPGEPPL